MYEVENCYGRQFYGYCPYEDWASPTDRKNNPDKYACKNCDYLNKPKQTNADRIRAMTDEELAVFLYGLVNEFGSMNHDCLDFNYCKVHAGEFRYDGWLAWLKEEATEWQHDKHQDD